MLYLNGERVALRGFQPSDEQNESTLKIFLDATKSTRYLFYQSTLTTVEGLIPYDDTENVTNMSYMFYWCTKLTTVPLFNTQNVTNMERMFSTCYDLTTVPLFNTQNVTNMERMFYDCYDLTTVPLLNAENATYTDYMFRGCEKLKTVKLSKVSNKIRNATDWFRSCRSLEVIDFSDATGVPTISNTNAFSGVPTTCKIVIPDSLYDTWTKATNWSALTQQFVKASEYTGG